MPRLTISLTDEQLKKIKSLSENKSMSLSYCGSTLLDIGLRVEQAVTETQKRPTAPIDLNTSEDILGKLLTWELESIYLMRYLIQNEPVRISGTTQCFFKRYQSKSSVSHHQAVQPSISYQADEVRSDDKNTFSRLVAEKIPSLS